MSELEALLAFQMRGVGLPEPRREYVFAPSRRWRFDFSWPWREIPYEGFVASKGIVEGLAVEVDGGTRTGGRHTRGDGYEKDAEKLNEAALMGWCVLRVTGDMVRDGRALRLIQRAFGEAPGGD